jgi:RNA polymerase sigma-70 factor (ECF subfamily)
MSILTNTLTRRKTGEALSDEAIWRMFAEGDDAAYTLLYLRFGDRLYAYLRLLLGYGPERFQIDDVFQDTWIRVYREREKFQIREGGTFSGWLFRIAHNFAISILRKPHILSPLDDLSDEMKREESMITNPLEPLTDLRGAEEVLGLMREIVDTLPVLLREVYVLSEFERFTMDTISEALGISKPNVKVRLFRARKIVRQRLLRALEIEDRQGEASEEE